jgi:Methyltransferase domain
LIIGEYFNSGSLGDGLGGVVVLEGHFTGSYGVILRGRGLRQSVLTALGAGSIYETIDSLSTQLERQQEDAIRLRASYDVALEKTTYLDGMRGADRLIELDFPVRPRVRYGWEAAPNPELLRIISAGEGRYADLVRQFKQFVPAVAAITPHETTPTDPHWVNDWFPAFDAISLYGLLAIKKPRRFVEIGSGTTTKFARRAIRDQNLSTKILSIDPFPRSEIDAICDQVIRSPLEETDLALFNSLTSDDLVLFDGSHRAFQNSDATVFFTEILPRLVPGVMVGVHDIFLPHDYPAEWQKRFYSEQYLLSCWLLAGARLKIELPLFYCTKTPAIHSLLDDLWASLSLQGSNKSGGMFWFTPQS